ncbi:DUF4136 domain-containing protein [Sphingomonas jeddahensis]|uniref:DUF4136 domain-containing protein n=1 Tax=Sphingomonas jeddahensis TaxID=1915074 RepID=A0A1V2EVB8_9SPHN|nr:DUF4136 domain-containing protein [Sphingomonas jeddahensis]ONF96621.1 hypothetical protein SPHI_08150 [Sphingomonas jeddahensis]
MRSVLIVIGMAAALAGCATGPSRFPVQTTRFHFNAMADRGTIAVEPLTGSGTASLEYKTYAAAVQSELLRLGYTSPAPGATAQFLATVSFSRTARPLPPRRSPVSIGLGGGGISGGRGGGVGLGGGVSFPIGGAGAGDGIVTELSVRIRQGADAVWEGQAQSLTDAAAPDANAAAIATRLARALFTGFPGESGRTIEVQ